MRTPADSQSGFLEDAPVTLIQEQSTGAANTQNSATVTFPGGDWPAGYGFTINLISTARNNQAIYAQSGQFNISSSGMAGSAVSSSSSSSSTMTMMRTSSTPTTMSRTTMTAGSGTSSGVSAAGAGDASGGIPNASVSCIVSVVKTRTDLCSNHLLPTRLLDSLFPPSPSSGLSPPSSSRPTQTLPRPDFRLRSCLDLDRVMKRMIER
jgi:hypothetical protein